MKKEHISDALNMLNDDIIEETNKVRANAKPTRKWVKWGAVAACLCLLVATIPIFLNKPETPKTGRDLENGTAARPSHIIVENRTFYISPYLSASDKLPDGFKEAGKANVGGFENCPYFLNPAIPEWVYVYHEVRTDGTYDSTGTLTRTEPHSAYVRYVDERLRGKDLISYNDKKYISIWSADPLGETPDVTMEYYDEMKSTYGVRIEGTVPDEFTLAGTAKFSGYDTIPTGILSSNTGTAKVYYTSGTPDVILMETSWFTAPVGENSETQHRGFNVYILYDCPLSKN